MQDIKTTDTQIKAYVDQNNYWCIEHVAFDSKPSNRYLDKSTGQYFVKNNPITAEEIADYYVVRDQHGNEQFPIKLARDAGFKYGDCVKVYRPWQEIEKAKDSFAMKPIVIGHKDYHVSKASKLPVGGYMGSSFATDNIKGKTALLLDCHFNDPEVIQKVEDKTLDDFSIGYDVKYVYKPGVFNGQKYDFVQTDIHCNHIALIPPDTARCDVAGVADQKILINNSTRDDMSEQTNALDKEVTLSGLASELEPKAKGKGADGDMGDDGVADDKDDKKLKEAIKKDEKADKEIKKAAEDKADEKADDKSDVKKDDKAKDELLNKLAILEAKVADMENQAQQKAQDSMDYEQNVALYHEVKRSTLSSACDSIEQASTAFDSLVGALKSHGRVSVDTTKFSVRDKQIFLAGYNAKSFGFDINKVKANDSSVSSKEIDGEEMTIIEGVN